MQGSHGSPKLQVADKNQHPMVQSYQHSHVQWPDCLPHAVLQISPGSRSISGSFQQKENKALKTHIVRTSILIPQILNFFFFRNLLSILDCQLQTLYKSLMVFYGVTVERSFCYYIKQLRECKIRLFSIQMSKQPKKIMGKSENLHQTCRRWMSSHFVPRPEIANHWRCNPNGAPCLKRREAGRVSEFPIWISIYRGPSTCLTWKHIEIRDVKTRKYLCMNGKMPSPLLAAKKSVKSCQRGVSTTGARRPPPTGSAKNPLRGSLMRPCRLPIHLPFRVTPYVIPRKILDTPMSHTHMQSVCKYRLYIYTDSDYDFTASPGFFFLWENIEIPQSPIEISHQQSCWEIESCWFQT